MNIKCNVHRMEGCAVCGVHTTSLCTNKYSNKRVKKRGKKTTKITAFVCGASVCIAVVLAMALHRCGAFFLLLLSVIMDTF